jgi:hypothetical protein
MLHKKGNEATWQRGNEPKAKSKSQNAKKRQKVGVNMKNRMQQDGKDHINLPVYG